LGGLLIAAEAWRLAWVGRSRWLTASPLQATVLLLAVVPLLQLAAGSILFHSDAILACLYLLAFAMSMAAGRSLARQPGSHFVEGLAWALLAAAVASAAIALIQWQQVFASELIVDLRPGDRPYSNLAQPNHLATLLGMGLAAVLLLYERRRLTGVTTVLLMAYIGWGLVMTQSRTGWLIVGLLVGWATFFRNRCALRTPLAAILLGGVAFAAAVASWSSINEALLISAPAAIGERLQPGTRLIYWPALWDAAWRHPLTGWGWQQVTIAQQVVSVDHAPVGEWLLQSHNIVLDLMIQNGALPGLAVTAVLGVWIYRRVRECADAESWALLALVGCFLTHALVEYPHEYAYFLLPVGLAMGALEARGNASNTGWKLPTAAFGSALVVLGAALILIAVEYLQIESALRTQRFVMMGIGLSSVPESPVPEVHLLDQPREVHRFWRTRARPGMSREELHWMRDVALREPRPAAQFRYALAAALNGEAQEANVTLSRMCQVHPAVRCEEGRQSWLLAQQQFPAMAGIPFPSPLVR
jgi:O-antigen ligase